MRAEMRELLCDLGALSVILPGDVSLEANDLRTTAL